MHFSDLEAARAAGKAVPLEVEMGACTMAAYEALHTEQPKERNMESTEIRVYPQTWPEVTKYILVHPNGTCQLSTWAENQESEITAAIHDLFVAPAHRRQGIATALLARAESIARANGHKTISLTYRYNTAPVAILEWYKRCGYAIIGYSRNEWVVLEKILLP